MNKAILQSMDFAERKRTARVEKSKVHRMSKHEAPDGQLEVVSRKYCISDIMTAMLDFGLVVYGQCTSAMEDYEDPRIGWSGRGDHQRGGRAPHSQSQSF
jgi:hypothetical protein